MAKRRKKSRSTAVKRGCGDGWKPNKSRTKCIRDRRRKRRRR